MASGAHGSGELAVNVLRNVFFACFFACSTKIPALLGGVSSPGLERSTRRGLCPAEYTYLFFCGSFRLSVAGVLL